MYLKIISIKNSLILLVFLLLFNQNNIAQTAFTFGPTLHVNFGNKENKENKELRTSWGFEFAYWNLSGSWPNGVNLGLEFSKKRFVIYSEGQIGLYLGGISAGAGIAFNKEDKTKFFLQGSIWGNLFLGIDIRLRTLKNDKITPGLYIKIPILPGGYNKFKEEFNKNHPDDGKSGKVNWFDD